MPTKASTTMEPLKLLRLVVFSALSLFSLSSLELPYLSFVEYGYVVNYKTYPRYFYPKHALTINYILYSMSYGVSYLAPTLRHFVLACFFMCMTLVMIFAHGFSFFFFYFSIFLLENLLFVSAFLCMF